MAEPTIEQGVLVREGAGQGFLNLRGNPVEERFRTLVAAAIGPHLPTTPCTFNRAEDATLYWLAPDEWLAAFPHGTQSERAQRLREALDGHFSVVDLSSGYVLFNLAGPDAGKVLQKSSPYDFHPRAFGPGRCTQTAFGKTTALVAHNPDSTFDLLVRSSYVTYVRRWLSAAAEEYAPKQQVFPFGGRNR